ncbi:hypothetical protein SDC9_161072 [bioreactor metagenome]|uniref:Uncharacterized protein n=1 Tax=bioreactor metagenome TaxID=1076179 RepID=A0A645FHD3_9ZZZZ
MVQGKVRKPSRFLKECNIIEDNVNSKGITKGDKVLHKSFGQGIVNQLENGSIDISFKNGNNRKFDLKILLDNNLIEKCE